MENVLLITGCIKPNKDAIFLKIKKSDVRLQQYIETIEWALNYSKFDAVIFCDNSNFQYNFNYLNKSNKKFEYLTFNGNFLKSNEYGKGYGEGEIIKYAFTNSKYLKNSSYFYKLTGRLKVENINEILFTSKNKNYFMRFLFNKNSMDTRFYKIKTTTYVQKFLNAYNDVRDKKGITLERVFFNIIKKNKLKYSCFRRYPIISGISGTTGIVYKTIGINNKTYNLLCKINLYNTKIILIIISKIILIKSKGKE